MKPRNVCAHWWYYFLLFLEVIPIPTTTLTLCCPSKGSETEEKSGFFILNRTSFLSNSLAIPLPSLHKVVDTDVISNHKYRNNCNSPQLTNSYDQIDQVNTSTTTDYMQRRERRNIKKKTDDFFPATAWSIFFFARKLSLVPTKVELCKWPFFLLKENLIFGILMALPKTTSLDLPEEHDPQIWPSVPKIIK